MTDADFQFFADTLSPGANTFGSLYFSLKVWVRANDGVIQAGSLEPGVTDRVTPLLYTYGGPTDHYEGGLSLRRIQRPAP
jgi:hypothetical protein